jgi:hypothetical protein
MKEFIRSPYRLFFITGLICFVIASIYRFYFRDQHVTISAGHYFTLSNYYGWALIGCYVMLLSGIYYVAHKGNLTLKNWKVNLHFIFLVLFLFFFFLLSSFDAHWVHRFISSLPFAVAIGIYGLVFLIDIFLFLAGVISLIESFWSIRKS